MRNILNFNAKKHVLNRAKMSHDEDYLFALQLQNELNALEENEAADVSLLESLILNLKIKVCVKHVV